MSENTARRYREEPGRGRGREARGYRTRPDPFAEVWVEVEGLLERAPGLSASTIFEVLCGREGSEFSEGQLRTLQRRVKRWRARRGPEKEVMFAQEHRPGEYGQSDFTVMNSLKVSIGGEALEHLFYHFVLPYSNWGQGVGSGPYYIVAARTSGSRTPLERTRRASRLGDGREHLRTRLLG